jgi:hypothetical protein
MTVFASAGPPQARFCRLCIFLQAYSAPALTPRLPNPRHKYREHNLARRLHSDRMTPTASACFPYVCSFHRCLRCLAAACGMRNLPHQQLKRRCYPAQSPAYMESEFFDHQGLQRVSRSSSRRTIFEDRRPRARKRVQRRLGFLRPGLLLRRHRRCAELCGERLFQRSFGRCTLADSLASLALLPTRASRDEPPTSKMRHASRD